MNTHRWLLPLSVTIACVHASSAQIDSAALSRDLDEGKFESLQQVRATDANAVLPVIRGYVIGKQEAISEPAMEAIRKVPNLVQWTGQDLQKRIAPGRLDFTIDENFELLGRLRTPEAVREIGRHINNDAILESPSDDLGSQVVSVSAALSLCLVGFSNAPTPNLWWSSGLGKFEVEAWQTWWNENQKDIDELVKKANEGPLPPPGKRYTTTPQTTSMGQLPASTPIQLAKSSAAPTPPPAAKSAPGFPIWLVAILGGLIVAVVVFLVRRRGYNS